MLTVILVLAITIAATCFIIIAIKMLPKLKRIFRNIPGVVWEILVYVITITYLVGCTLTPMSIKGYLGLGGALLLVGALWLTSYLHERVRDGFIFSSILAVVWIITALMYDSELIGFFAVGAVASAIAFSMPIEPICHIFGYEADGAKGSLGRSTITGFSLMVVFIGLQFLNTLLPIGQIFSLGALVIGSLMGYLGILTIATRWYEGKRKYIWYQPAAIGAGAIAIAIGLIGNMPILSKIGGTVILVYALEKPFEIKGTSTLAKAGIGFLVSLIVVGICLLAISNPGLLRPFLLIGN